MAAKAKRSILNILSGKKSSTANKKSAAQISDSEKTAAKSGSTGASAKSGNSTTTPSNRQKATSSQKNSGSTVQGNGTAKTGTTNAGVPNTNPNITKNVYKKGGTLATLGLGAALGGVGTYLMGLKETLFPSDKTDETGNDNTQNEENNGNVWDNLNEDAAELLDGAADLPVVGDAVTAAKEGGWSFALLAGIVIALIAAGVFVYKKVGKKAKTAKRKAAARKHTAAKKVVIVG